MRHNKHVCVVLYEDEEYETLVLECYWQSKTNVKYSYNCYIYECIYYSQQFLDKNGILYHKFMNLCKSWNGSGVLKMYSTWTRSNKSKLKRVALIFGKDTNTPVKSSATSDDDHPRKRQRNAGKVDQHKIKKSIEIADNVNLARKSMVTTPIVTTKLDVNEIIVVGCLETIYMYVNRVV